MSNKTGDRSLQRDIRLQELLASFSDDAVLVFEGQLDFRCLRFRGRRRTDDRELVQVQFEQAITRIGPDGGQAHDLPGSEPASQEDA